MPSSGTNAWPKETIFFNTLVWPVVDRLMGPVAGQRLLDVACGGGVTSRRLADAKARVTAIDFSEEMIACAKKRRAADEIDYRVVDATDAGALRKLGAGAFDGALCNMGLMDMADIDPLMNALAHLLKPGGRFVFSVVHPCFNNPAAVLVSEFEDRAGTPVTTHSVRISRYLTPYTQPGLAMCDQPEPHPYFHRPLTALLAAMFRAGLVLDAFEEGAFPPNAASGSGPLSWRSFADIPPALVARVVRPRA